MSFGSNVRVISDGLPSGTRVEVDGTPIEGILSLRWEMKSHAHVGVLTLRLEGAEVDAHALRVLLKDEAGEPV
jgi:hypothetical protein